MCLLVSIIVQIFTEREGEIFNEGEVAARRFIPCGGVDASLNRGMLWPIETKLHESDA